MSYDLFWKYSVYQETWRKLRAMLYVLIFYGRGGMKISVFKSWIFITYHNDLVDLHKSLPGFEL